MLSRAVLHQPLDEPRVDGTLIGPLLVLAEAEQPDCAISTVYVSRFTDPQLIGRLEHILQGSVPITETSAAELTTLAAGRRHDGVVAILHGRRRHERRNKAALFLFALRMIVGGRG